MKVNGRIVDVPSCRLSEGDEVAVRERSRELELVAVSLGARTRPPLAEWLSLDEKKKVGRVVRQPARSDVPLAAQEQLIVELYSK